MVNHKLMDVYLLPFCVVRGLFDRKGVSFGGKRHFDHVEWNLDFVDMSMPKSRPTTLETTKILPFCGDSFQAVSHARRVNECNVHGHQVAVTADELGAFCGTHPRNVVDIENKTAYFSEIVYRNNSLAGI